MSSPLKLKNFINGCFKEHDAVLESVNPATVEVFATLPDSGSKQINEAVAAATAAFPAWSKLPAQQRANYMMKIADLLEARKEEFAVAESQDQGKPVWLTRAVDIPRAILNFRHFAQTAPHMLNTSKMLTEASSIAYTSREPIGVAGLISPWNLPIYLLTFKVAPALMTGNTVVCKPSEFTSVTAFMLCQLFQEACVPPGVFNVVFGRGPMAGAALVQHPQVPVVSFTGSTATGAFIAKAAAPLFKKVSLELGGKNAAIVYSDCDVQSTLDTLMRSCFINQGQVCLCTSRVYIHASIYEDFLQRFIKAASEKKVGDPNDPSVFLGALNSEQHLAKVRSCVARAVEQGGIVQCGQGKDVLQLPPHCSKGYFMAPTIITDMPDTADCMTEEIFGPVACVTPFTTDAEVVERVNSVRYGLCASVFTSNLSTAHRVAQELQVGTVWINSWLVRDLDLPFGGTKDSGLGREGTHDSWDFYTEQKCVSIKM